jgi:hypothetical protein
MGGVDERGDSSRRKRWEGGEDRKNNNLHCHSAKGWTRPLVPAHFKFFIILF